MKKAINSLLLALMAALLLNTASAQNSTAPPAPGPSDFSEPDYDYFDYGTDSPCTTDQECLGDYALEDVYFPFCVAESCAECRTSDDCPNGKECLEGSCGSVPCETNDDCKDKGSPDEEFVCTESKICHSVTDYGDYEGSGYNDYSYDSDYDAALTPGGSPGINITNGGSETSTIVSTDQKSGAMMPVALVSTLLSVLIGVMFA
jgi:hypothetical protein